MIHRSPFYKEYYVWNQINWFLSTNRFDRNFNVWNCSSLNQKNGRCYNKNQDLSKTLHLPNFDVVFILLSFMSNNVVNCINSLLKHWPKNEANLFVFHMNEEKKKHEWRNQKLMINDDWWNNLLFGLHFIESTVFDNGQKAELFSLVCSLFISLCFYMCLIFNSLMQSGNSMSHSMFLLEMRVKKDVFSWRRKTNALFNFFECHDVLGCLCELYECRFVIGTRHLAKCHSYKCFAFTHFVHPISALLSTRVCLPIYANAPKSIAKHFSRLKSMRKSTLTEN